MKALWLSLFLLVPVFLFAQTQSQKLIDSILYELPKTKNDTNKVNLLNKLAIIYKETDLDTALDYSFQALAMAEKSGWLKGIAEAHNNIGNIYTNAGSFDEALKNHNTALNIRRKSSDEKGIADSYNNIGIIYIYLGDSSKAFGYLFSALDIRKRIADKKGVSDLYNNIGAIYTTYNNFTSALKHYSSAFEIQRELGNKKGMASSLHNIGVCYKEQGNFPEALNNYFSALKADEEVKNLRGMAATYNSIALLYQSVDEYSKSQTYLNQSIALFQKAGDKYGEGSALNNLANILYVQDSFGTALKCASQALTINTETGNTEGVANAYNNLGAIHKDAHQYPEALKNFFIALELYKNLGYLHGMAGVYGNIAMICREQKKLREAEQYALKSLELARQSNAKEWERNANEILSEIYTETGQTLKAFNTYKVFIAQRDSLLNVESAKKLVQIRMQYDFDRKEDSIKAVHEKQITQEIANSRAKMQTGSIAGLSALLFITGGFIFYRKREADKFNLQLAAVKQEVLNAQMSDHFIGNTMDSINHFIRNNDKEKASEYLIRFSRLIRNVLEHATEKTITLNEDLNVLKDYLELEKLRFANYALEYEIVIDDTIDIHKILIPPMVFQTLAENAVKHGFKSTSGGKLLLNISKEKNTVVCSIEDNGSGRGLNDAGKNKRKSIGSGLAEKLVKTVSRYGRKPPIKSLICLMHKRTLQEHW